MKKLFDPELGEMIGIAEVSEMTGLTKAQLRNWRKPEHAHLARIKGYQESFSRDVWYRLLDVQKYLADNGVRVGASPLIALEAPNAVEAPLLDPLVVGKEKRFIKMLTDINPETVADAHEKLSTLNRPIVMRYANTVKNRFLEEELGSYSPSENPITKDKRFASPVWFTAMTKAMRLAQNEIANLGFTEEEVLALPVGQVPPLRESKFVS